MPRNRPNGGMNSFSVNVSDAFVKAWEESGMGRREFLEALLASSAEGLTKPGLRLKIVKLKKELEQTEEQLFRIEAKEDRVKDVDGRLQELVQKAQEKVRMK